MAASSGEATPVSQAAQITQGGKGEPDSTSLAAQMTKIKQCPLDYIARATPVLTGAFQNDPIFNYFMGALSEEERKEFLPTFLTSLLKAGVLNKGIIIEVSSWGCCAIMLPPGKKADNPRTLFQAGLPGLVLRLKSTGIKVGEPRMLVEHSAAVKRAKKKAFTPKQMSEFWYLFIIDGSGPPAPGPWGDPPRAYEGARPESWTTAVARSLE
ncbi:hypothetical protein E0Z10_g6072 [Xylaria hypoxylon]|uniref:Uncharacterized protein n=1 Tax=Xylaria hypoxylon TaxID=37992 RepID=A0A4Z0YF43_9PEZI|nr:hypothetical protein E0Z10_g6072 [Xylaria hypoxylon]